MRAALPAGLALVREVIDPVDQALEYFLPEERAVPLFAGAEGPSEAEVVGDRSSDMARLSITECAVGALTASGRRTPQEAASDRSPRLSHDTNSTLGA